MPKFVSESGFAPPFDGVTYNYTSGIMAIPSGESFLSVAEVRLISDTASIMSSEIKLSPSSGVVAIVTATSGWIRLGLS